MSADLFFCQRTDFAYVFCRLFVKCLIPKQKKNNPAGLECPRKGSKANLRTADLRKEVLEGQKGPWEINGWLGV